MSSSGSGGGEGRGSQFDGYDNVTQKFTGKERDSETSLDYFGARYYGAGMGRWVSPDNGVNQHQEDPQSWSLYAYVRNNPLNKTDPDGRDCFQGPSSCADYPIGGLKAVGNLPSDLYNAPNRIIDAGLSLFTSFQFGDAILPTFKPSNQDQAERMNAASAVMMMAPFAGEAQPQAPQRRWVMRCR